jgi:hypothetical protein
LHRICSFLFESTCRVDGRVSFRGYARTCMRRQHYNYLVDKTLQISECNYDKVELHGTCFVSIGKVSVCFKIRGEIVGVTFYIWGTSTWWEGSHLLVVHRHSYGMLLLLMAIHPLHCLMLLLLLMLRRKRAMPCLGMGSSVHCHV